MDHYAEKIEEFLKQTSCDSIFAVNEHFAVEAIRALRTQGRSVPEDVSVIAFTDGELSKHFIPSLTTIKQKGLEMGATAAKLLIDKLERPEDEKELYQTVILETSLIERESTK